MEYDVGKVGRVIVARLFEGEDLYGQVQALAAKENIRSAVVLAVGGLACAKVVVGPKALRGPIQPQFRQFDDAREIVAVGTIFPDESGPVLHLHAGIGRGDETLVGCPRGGASVFCVLEVIVLEIEGVDGRRLMDERAGLKLLRLAQQAKGT
jgi:predicted DNA-binding protein with PD1-like motif